jgi:uncharacterized protein YozE (UPF0346 family)
VNPEGRMLSFTDWLARHRTTQSAIGDLARDVAADSDWPGGHSYRKLRDYLDEAGAIPAALDTFEVAWTMWALEAGAEVPDAVLVRVAAGLLYERDDPRASRALPADTHAREVMLGLLRSRLRGLADELDDREAP